jgi:hypothetical protein
MLHKLLRSALICETFLIFSEALALYDNELSGTIPSRFERLVNLGFLYLDNTSLGPYLPEGICDLGLEEFWADCEDIGGCSCCARCCTEGSGCL